MNLLAGPGRFWGAAACCGALCVALFSLPAAAQSGANRAVILTQPDLSAETFLRDFEALEAADIGGSLGLLSASSPAPGTAQNAYLSVASGRRLASRENLTALRLDLAPPESKVGRTGGSGAALRRGSVRVRPSNAASALTEAVRARGEPALVVEIEPGMACQNPGILLALDSQGSTVGVQPVAAANSTERWAEIVGGLLEEHPVVFVDLPPSRSARRALELTRALTERLDSERDLLLVTGPNPGRPSGGMRSELGPLLLWGGRWSGATPISTSTRTPGLLSNVDLVPTVLEHLELPPPAEVDGHAAQEGSSLTVEQILRSARRAREFGEWIRPLLVGWGALCAVAFAFGLQSVSRSSSSRVRYQARGGLAACVLFLAGLLWWAAPPLRGEQPPEWLLLWMAIPLGLGWGALRSSRSPVTAAVTVCAATILVDLSLHGRALAENLMSNFPLIGARYYGIGNEYLGILLAAALTLPFALTPPAARWGATSVVVWVLLLLSLPVGAPSLGADFGGALALVITAALISGTAGGNRGALMRSALFGLIVAGVGGVLILADLARPAAERTHLGTLAARAMEQGGAPLIDMVRRKLLLNLETAVSPYTLGGFAALAVVLTVWYHTARTALDGLRVALPGYRERLRAVTLGGAAATFLNDTGVVCGSFVLGISLFVLLDGVLASDSNCLNPTGNPREKLRCE